MKISDSKIFKKKFSGAGNGDFAKLSLRENAFSHCGIAGLRDYGALWLRVCGLLVLRHCGVHCGIAGLRILRHCGFPHPQGRLAGAGVVFGQAPAASCLLQMATEPRCAYHPPSLNPDCALLYSAAVWHPGSLRFGQIAILGTVGSVFVVFSPQMPGPTFGLRARIFKRK